MQTGDADAAETRFDPKRGLPDGWDARVQFGAQSTSGASRTSSFSGTLEATYRSDGWEHRLTAKALHSTSSLVVPRIDASGAPLLDTRGKPMTELVHDRTNDRRFLAAQPRWYFREEKNYVFAILDVETNEPADIELSSRQIAGVGYRLWSDKSDYFSAGVGVGRKRLEQVSGHVDEGLVGYVGLDVVRRIGERSTFQTLLESDFGGENRFTELALTFSWKLSEPVALKLGYEARMNSDLRNPTNPFDESVDARASLSLEVDLF